MIFGGIFRPHTCWVTHRRLVLKLNNFVRSYIELGPKEYGERQIFSPCIIGVICENLIDKTLSFKLFRLSFMVNNDDILLSAIDDITPESIRRSDSMPAIVTMAGLETFPQGRCTRQACQEFWALCLPRRASSTVRLTHSTPGRQAERSRYDHQKDDDEDGGHEMPNEGKWRYWSEEPQRACSFSPFW